MQKYQFYPYDPEVLDRFDQEKLRLAALPLCIEHVGSTSVPGLGGKGILDLLLGSDSPELTAWVPSLEALGYIYRPHASVPGRLFLRRKSEARVHVHLVQVGQAEWQSLLGFKEALLAHPEWVHEYATLKKEAVSLAQGDGQVYRDFKAPFIERVLSGVSLGQKLGEL